MEPLLEGISRLFGDDDGPESFLDATPVEDEIFKQHTRWPGLLFKTVRVERAFLDGQARISKTQVYVGYIVLAVVLFATTFISYLRGLYVYTWCSFNKSFFGTDAEAQEQFMNGFFCDKQTPEQVSIPGSLPSTLLLC